MTKERELIPCPYCRSDSFEAWAEERGFTAVRCRNCRLLYCNPRPALPAIDSAVRSGAHGSDAGGLDVTSRRVPRRVLRYQRIFDEMFDDLWAAGKPVSWMDVGAGYGEVLEALLVLAPKGSRIVGLEPMHPKAEKARERGLSVVEDYLRPEHGRVERVQVVSTVDVFSHIPDFWEFLLSVKAVLQPGGELFVETGNLADLQHREEFPGELGLPDHLVFAGESHLLGFLERAGFDVVRIRRERIDGLLNLGKNVIKKLIGRPAQFGMPYTSAYRQLQVRARLR